MRDTPQPSHLPFVMRATQSFAGTACGLRPRPRVRSSPFPLRHDRGGDAVADHVGGRAAHVEEVIDAEQQQQAGLGNAELRQRRGDHDQRGARHAGDALRRQHQDREHHDLLADRQLDAVDLRDEHHRERAVHHRAVEIERVAERQHEARDAVAAAEALQLFQRLRIRRFGARGREREDRRLAHAPDQPQHARADDEPAEHDQHRPQDAAAPR